MATTTPTKAAENGRKSITIDLTGAAAVYDHIVNEAELDDRTPAKWVSRFLAHHFSKNSLETPK
jgi:hypothetical protein